MMLDLPLFRYVFNVIELAPKDWQALRKGEVMGDETKKVTNSAQSSEGIAAEMVQAENEVKQSESASTGKKLEQKEADPPEKKKKQNRYVKQFVDLICDIILPVVCMFVVSGVLKGLMVLCTSVGLLTSTDGTYLIMWALADGIIYFLPMMLAYTCSKRFDCSPFAAMSVAGALLYPSITSAADAGTAMTFLGIPVMLVNYGYTILPIIFAVALLAWLEHRIDKIMPDSVSAFFTPLIACALVVPVTFLAIGPVMNALSDGMAWLYNTFYALAPAAAGALVGFAWHCLTLFGLHLATFPIILANIDSYGFDTICPMVGMACVAQAGACFAVFLKSKNTKTKGVASAAALSGVLGSTEVCVFGVTFQLKRPFWIANITGGIFGAAVGILGTTSPSLIAPGIETIIAFYGPTFLIYLGLYCGCFVVTALVTYFLGYTRAMDKKELRVDDE